MDGEVRILFLNHTAAMGGAEWSMLDIATLLRVPCSVALLEDGLLRRHLDANGVPVEVIKSGSRLSNIRRRSGALTDLAAIPVVLSTAVRVARRARSFDIVYANSQKSLFIGSLAGVIARRRVVWHQRDIANSGHFNFWHRLLVALFVNLLVFRVIANSNATAEALFRCGVRRRRVIVIYNGIDPALFENIDDATLRLARKALGGDQDYVTVGLFGRIAHWKGQHVLVDALSRLEDGIQAIFVGDALFGEGEYYSNLRSEVEKRHLENRVRFLGFRSDVPALMKACDIVVHASIAPEAFGRVIVEAMLAARPVIASGDGGVLEIIEHGVNGILVTPGDAAALAEAISALARNAELRESLSMAGLESAKKRFAVTRTVDQVSETLICSARRR